MMKGVLTCFFLVFFFFALTSCEEHNDQNSTYVNSIKKSRKEKNQEFLNKETTPFEEKDLKSFIGLNYFPIDTAFRITASFTPIDTVQPFKMATSTEREPMYRLAGVVSFELENLTHTLEVYESVDNPDDPFAFIPFTDETSAFETYGSGRYIDFDLPKEKKVVTLDFNKAYNPYCAYNDNYSCPVPPRQNNIEVSIKAGERVYKQHD